MHTNISFFTVSSTLPDDMLAYITPCNELSHVFNTTFLTKKEALITMV
jgi:hypothetical protein